MTTQPSEKNAFGRPREYDRIDVFTKLVEWAMLPTSINLNAFSGYYGIAPSKLILMSKENDDFRQVYEQVKSIIGARREEKLSTGDLHQRAYDRNAHVYDLYAREEHRDELAYASKLKKEEEGSKDTEDSSKKLDDLVSILRSHSSTSNFKIAENNNSNDSKS